MWNIECGIQMVGFEEGLTIFCRPIPPPIDRIDTSIKNSIQPLGPFRKLVHGKQPEQVSQFGWTNVTKRRAGPGSGFAA
jgi:hypothetical protein